MLSAARREPLLGLLLVVVGAAEGGAQVRPVPAVLRHQEIVMHKDSRSIDHTCRSERNVRACTDFVAERFTCGCSEQGGKWVISASLEYDIVIHAIDTRYLQHERQHMLGIVRELPKALERFTRLEMTERSTCENLAKVMSAPSFARDVMNRLRRESNEHLGCTPMEPERRKRGTLIAAVHAPQ